MEDSKCECDLPVMCDGGRNIVLFYPHVPSKAKEFVAEALESRWVGQGPRVEQFEKRFVETLGIRHRGVAVGAGTDALHLAYVLAGVQAGDEVIVPVFTCTATNIPLLYHDVRIRFADIQPRTMNIDVDHVRRLANERTKAIVCVHYGGLPCDMDELLALARDLGIPVIEDAAHAVGAAYHGEVIGNLSPYTMFSFQAIKHVTTGDGGMLVLRSEELVEKAERLRWFGIDRRAKQGGYWRNDIVEVGYKYQMNDIGAAIGLAALDELPYILEHRRRLFQLYQECLGSIPGVEVVGAGYQDREHGCWLCTVLVEKREDLVRKLREANIESGQVHYRNDRYSIFSEFVEPGAYPNMDRVEPLYLVLPLHTRLVAADVQRICDVISRGW
ncbi:MAG: DegT/DnrJ/EryC1/StrS family aminotransferase [Planctomycetota bacterium]